MRGKDEKRSARRIRLEPAIDGDLSHFPVRVVDLSSSGARVEHEAPLSFHPGKRYLLEFRCDGEQFRLNCTVARARLEMNSAGKLVYASGVHFVEVDEPTLERLWGLIGWLAMDELAHEGVKPEIHEFQILSH
jgi:hypothetical protein